MIRRGNYRRGTRPSLEVVRVETSLAFQPMMGLGWLVAIVCLTIYGSLIPFRFQTNLLSANNGFGLFLITWYPSTIEDFLTNLFVYAVVGFVAFSVLRNNCHNTVVSFVFTMLTGVLLSVLVESCQSATASRVASWIDVASDIVGVLLGATSAWTTFLFSNRFGHYLRIRVRSCPYSFLALCLTLALGAFHLFPFDFVHSTGQLKASFLRADWHMLAMIHSTYWLDDLPSALSHVETAGWFALLGYIFFVGRMEQSSSRTHAMVSTLRHGFILVIVIEFLQLFTMSHVFESADIILRCIAISFGACFARTRTHASAIYGVSEKRTYMISITLLLTAAVLQAAALLVSAYINGKANHVGVTEAASIQLPFMALWQSSLRVAMGKVLSVFVCYSCLSWTLVILVRRLRINDAGVISCCLIVFVACRATMFEQGASLFTLDFTTPILAVIVHTFVFRASDYVKRSVGLRMQGDLSSLSNEPLTSSAQMSVR